MLSKRIFEVVWSSWCVAVKCRRDQKGNDLCFKKESTFTDSFEKVPDSDCVWQRQWKRNVKRGVLASIKLHTLVRKRKTLNRRVSVGNGYQQNSTYFINFYSPWTQERFLLLLKNWTLKYDLSVFSYLQITLAYKTHKTQAKKFASFNIVQIVSFLNLNNCRAPGGGGGGQECSVYVNIGLDWIGLDW